MLYILLSASQPSLSYGKGQAMRISWIWSGLDTTALHWHSGAASRQDPCVGMQTSTRKGTGTSAAEAAGWVYLDNAEMRNDPRLHKAELGISSGTFSLQESHSLPYPFKPPLPSPPPPSCLLHGGVVLHARHPQHLPACLNPECWTSQQGTALDVINPMFLVLLHIHWTQTCSVPHPPEAPVSLLAMAQHSQAHFSIWDQQIPSNSPGAQTHCHYTICCCSGTGTAWEWHVAQGSPSRV